MNKAQTLRLARRAFVALHNAFPREVERAYKAAIAGERAHRRGSFGHYHPGAASAVACAELFVARWAADYALNPDTLPTLGATVQLREDAVACAALVAYHGADKVRAALADAQALPADVAALDYCVAVRSGVK